MAQILPQPTHFGSFLGEQLGNSLAQAAQEGNQFALNKSRLTEAFQPLAQNPLFKNLAQIAPALLSTSGGSQALAEIAPLLLQQALNQNTPTPGADQTPGADNAQQQGIPGATPFMNRQLGLIDAIRAATQKGAQNKPPQGNPANIQNASQEVGKNIAGRLKPLANENNPFNLDFSLPSNYKGRITPNQEANVIAQMRKNGATSSQIADYRLGVDRFNQGQVTADELNDLAFSRQKQRIGTSLALEQDVKNFVNERLGDKAKENPYNADIAYSLLQDKIKNQEAPDLTRAWTQIEKQYNDLVRQKDTFVDKIPGTPFGATPPNAGFGIFSKEQKELANDAQSLLKQAPIMKDILREVFKSKGNNIYDTDRILNKPQPHLDTKIKDAKNFSDQLGKKPIQEIRNEQEKYVPILAKNISNSWNDNSSAITLSRELKLKGYFPDQISEIFRILEDEGKLTSEQRSDANEASKTPVLLKDFWKSWHGIFG